LYQEKSGNPASVCLYSLLRDQLAFTRWKFEVGAHGAVQNGLCFEVHRFLIFLKSLLSL
jgi:hypothetical protein